MRRLILFVCLLISVNARSVDKVNEKRVLKRAASGEFYPDWVPFKNKQGEELGEFVQVENKKKPKKRLALPINFKLKPMAAIAPESDYDDFGGGVGDGEEDFDKKEWSDLHRSGHNATPIKNINHTDISDIDGVVNIITQPNPLISKIINSNKSYEVTTAKNAELAPVKRSESEDYTEDQSKETVSSKETVGLKNEEKATQPIENQINDDNESKNNEESKKSDVPDTAPEDEYYDDEVEKNKKLKEKQEQTENERKESEARKALILSSVDELKARHKAEQVVLSEKAKEEEIFKEEHERDKYDSEEGRDKYDRRKPKVSLDYEYEEPVETNNYDKYKINLERSPKTSTQKPQRQTPTRKPKRRKHKKTEHQQLIDLNTPEKLSVFKNPEAYIVNEEDQVGSTSLKTTTMPKRTTVSRKNYPKKFSAAYRSTSLTTPKTRDESVRISLVPETPDSDGSPTLFFPQTKRNNRKRKRGRASTRSPDSSSVESSEKRSTNLAHNVLDTSTTDVIDTTAADSKIVDTTSENKEIDVANDSKAGDDIEPTGVDAISTNSNVVADVISASTDKKEEKHGDFEHKAGGGREFSSSHEEVHKEMGKKAYEGKHEDTKGAKGHHDKEDHSGEYVDKAGTDKKHHDESNHYGAHHHEEHGKKHAKYEESGKHSKGHSTKGSHDIHKKEEYEKKVEFFDEDGDSSEEEKHGGYNHERGHSTGGSFKNGKLEAGHHHHDKGDAGHHLKGGHAHGHKSHKQAQGHDAHGRHHQAHFKKAGHHGGKKWGYIEASPGKVANLIAIDRRADQFYNGPQYYG